MKTLYVFLIFCLSIGISFAQPTFNLNSFPGIGSSSTSYDVSASILSPGNSGAGQAWNFGLATGTLAMNTVTMVAPSATPFSGLFPTSNQVGVTVSTGGNDAYGYYVTNSASINLIGAGTNGTPAVILVYSNPQTAINFPFTYGSVVNDTYVAHASYSVSGFNVEIFRTGQVNTNADGYGTLITPTGTYSNCLRAKIIDMTRDSIVYIGIPLPATIVVNRATSYSYFGSTSLNALFAMTFDTTDNAGTISQSFSASYSTFSTNVNVIAVHKELTVYPNPAINVSEISLTSSDLKPGNVLFSIYNIEGRLIRNVEATIESGIDLKMDISDLPPGIFTIQLRQENRTYKTVMIR